MVFLFNDSGSSIKHLFTILSSRSITDCTLRITEALPGRGITEDLLFYDSAAILSKDIKRLAAALDKYTKYMNQMERERIGFRGESETPNE